MKNILKMAMVSLAMLSSVLFGQTNSTGTVTINGQPTVINPNLLVGRTTAGAIVPVQVAADGTVATSGSGGGGSGTSSLFGSAFPSSGTALGVSNGTNMVALLLGQATMANSVPVAIASNQGALAVTGTFWQATQPVSGTFWQATQPVSGTFWQATQPVSVADLTGNGSITTQNLNPNSGAATAGSTVAVTSVNSGDTLAIQVTGTYTGALTVQGTVDGSNWIAAPLVINYGANTQSSTIPSAAVGIFQVGTEGFTAVRVTALGAMTGTAVVTLRETVTDASVAIDGPYGQAAASNSIPVALANEDVNDSLITGQGSQLTLNNNIILATAGSGSTTATGYRSWSIEIVPAAGTVTAGNITFEGSNDGTNFQAIYMYDANAPQTAPVTTYALAAATNRFWKGSLQWTFIRARISTGVTGTTTGIQAFTRLSQTPFLPDLFQVASSTTANLLGNTNVVSISGTAIVTAGLAGIQAIGGNIADGSAQTANPVEVAGYTVLTVPAAALGNSITKRIPISGDYQVIVHQDGDPSNEWQATSGLAAFTSTASTALKTAGGSGIRNYVTGIQLINTSTTASTVTLLDGSTVIWSISLPATSTSLQAIPVNVEFRTPLKGSAATAMNIQQSGAANLWYNVQGFQAN